MIFQVSFLFIEWLATCTRQNMRPGNGGCRANRKHLHVNKDDAPHHPVTPSSCGMLWNASLETKVFLLLMGLSKVWDGHVCTYTYTQKKVSSEVDCREFLWVTDIVIALGELIIPLPDGNNFTLILFTLTIWMNLQLCTEEDYVGDRLLGAHCCACSKIFYS